MDCAQIFDICLTFFITIVFTGFCLFFSTVFEESNPVRFDFVGCSCCDWFAILYSRVGNVQYKLFGQAVSDQAQKYWKKLRIMHFQTITVSLFFSSMWRLFHLWMSIYSVPKFDALYCEVRANGKAPSQIPSFFPHLAVVVVSNERSGFVFSKIDEISYRRWVQRCCLSILSFIFVVTSKKCGRHN